MARFFFSLFKTVCSNRDLQKTVPDVALKALQLCQRPVIKTAIMEIITE